MLIGRVWHGLTREKCGDEYLQRLETKRVAAYRRTPGNLGVLVFQRKTSGVAEFFVISMWESYEAMRKPLRRSGQAWNVTTMPQVSRFVA